MFPWLFWEPSLLILAIIIPVLAATGPMPGPIPAPGPSYKSGYPSGTVDPHEFYGYFLPKPTPAPVPWLSAEMTCPDGNTRYARPGKAVLTAVTITNSGKTPWLKGVVIVPAGSTPTGRMNTPETQTGSNEMIPAGRMGNILCTIQAPDTPGTYTYTYQTGIRIQNADGFYLIIPFGDPVTITLIVLEDDDNGNTDNDSLYQSEEDRIATMNREGYLKTSGIDR
ncbi:MAG: hypothetical protein JXA44_01670 [Methanospirillaceae archaeon]|nr:hypothetical protein [Methanospirillaceae archaeon]